MRPHGVWLPPVNTSYHKSCTVPLHAGSARTLRGWQGYYQVGQQGARGVEVPAGTTVYYVDPQQQYDTPQQYSYQPAQQQQQPSYPQAPSGQQQQQYNSPSQPSTSSSGPSPTGQSQQQPAAAPTPSNGQPSPKLSGLYSGRTSCMCMCCGRVGGLYVSWVGDLCASATCRPASLALGPTSRPYIHCHMYATQHIAALLGTHAYVHVVQKHTLQFTLHTRPQPSTFTYHHARNRTELITCNPTLHTLPVATCRL